MSSLRQQWGRAGRRGHGLAVLVASEDALDQYFMREPETLLRRRVEAAILDHENDRVLDGHVRAAAFEAPLDEQDTRPRRAGARASGRAPRARAHEGGLGLERPRLPGRTLRPSLPTPDPFTIVDEETGSVLGIAERERAYSTVHDGAIYLHAGESYRVTALDLEGRTALVEPFRGDYYTQAKKETTTAIDEELRRMRALGCDVFFGRVP